MTKDEKLKIKTEKIIEKSKNIYDTACITHGYKKMRMRLHPKQFEDLDELCNNVIQYLNTMYISSKNTGKVSMPPEYMLGCHNTISLFREFFIKNIFIKEK